MGRRTAPHGRAHQRRDARGCSARARAWRPGHRPVPHRAHVHGRGPPAEDARDDHGGHRLGAPRGAGGAATAPTAGLRRTVRGHGRSPGDDPPPRPAAPRVPPRPRPRDRRPHARADQTTPGGEPDARDARLPARPHAPGDLRDAGAGDHPRRDRRPRANRGGPARRDHAPAGRVRGGAPPAAGADRRGRAGGG